MNNESLKIYFLNIITIAITLTDLEAALKITLLCASILYTVMKIIDWIIIKIKNKNVNNNKETIQD
jgi:hypothetical protein